MQEWQDAAWTPPAAWPGLQGCLDHMWNKKMYDSLHIFKGEMGVSCNYSPQVGNGGLLVVVESRNEMYAQCGKAVFNSVF